MKLTVIGTGNMGQALLNGILNGSQVSAREVTVFDVDAGKAGMTAEKLGCQCADSAAEAVRDASYVLVAVKPQHFDKAVSGFADSIPENAVLISIAAGVRINRIRKLVGVKTGIARVFPNTPALVGKGVSAVSFDSVVEEDRVFIHSILETCGIVIPCDENTLDAIGCVSGTGPAWVMLFAEALADGAVLAGVPRPIAMKIAAATIEGSGRMLMETGLHPAVLKDQVCSPGGTTIEGVRILEKGSFRSSIIEAVAAAADKTGKMASND